MGGFLIRAALRKKVPVFRIRSYSGLYFPVFGLNVDRYGPEQLRIRYFLLSAAFRGAVSIRKRHLLVGGAYSYPSVIGAAFI